MEININEEIKNKLEALKNSPVIEQRFYSQMEHLCGAIGELTSNISEHIEDANEDIEKNTPRMLKMRLEFMKNLCFQIGVVTDVLKEKATNDDLSHVCGLLYFLLNKDKYPEGIVKL